ncbi:MAG TPA: DUF1549 and DUF1553 domain-containing protein [Pirellulales bacterium]|jgi:hypothetical protein|nr:DUF1549 and DUF1553 domain-containing protein [Pirellulales bacterium]
MGLSPSPRWFSDRLLPPAAAFFCAIVLGAAALCEAAKPTTSPAKPDSLSLLVERRAARLAELPPVSEPPAADETLANPIDRFIVADWAPLPADARPTALCDDATFARRVYLDLIGVIPSRAELNKFLADSSPDKRAKLIDRLLDRKAEYAAHWTVFWEDALASQNVLAQGGIPTRGNYRQWLLDSFATNKPYDVMLAELIDPSMPGHQAAVNQDLFGTKYQVEFVRNEDHTVTLQTAAVVGQVFLSTAMKCASCHDHFENPQWTQERFLGFAGLFAAADLEKIRCDVHSGKHVAARFPFDLPGPALEIPSQLDDRLHVAALLIVDPANELFAKSIVNRLWKRYLGWGLFEPVDDYRPERAASHPALLAWLARDFVAHGCDLKHTIWMIVNSRAYQLPYEPKFADRYDAADPTAARYFRSPALRRLTAEQVIDSVRMAANGQLQPGERAYLDARITALAAALGRPASRNEISTARSDESAVVQALELLNGPEIQELVDSGVLVAQPAGKPDPKALVDRLYRSILSRPATLEEKRLGQALLSASPSLSDGLKDIGWALVVSPEFQFIK